MDEHDDLELAVNAEEMCRSCLVQADSGQLKPLFCNEILDGKIIPFPKILETVIGMKLSKNDKLPNQICIDCKVKLRELYCYIEKVRKNDGLLYKIFRVSKPPLLNTGVTEPPTPKETKCQHTQTDPTVSVQKVDQATQAEVSRTSVACQKGKPLSAAIDAESAVPGSTGQSDSEDKQVEVLPFYIIDSKESEEKEDKDGSNEATSKKLLPVVTVDEDEQENEYEVMVLENEENDSSDFDDDKSWRKTEYFTLYSADNSDPSKDELADGTDESAAMDTKRAKPVVKRSTPVGERLFCFMCNCKAITASQFDEHIQIHRQTLEACLVNSEYYRCCDCFHVFLSLLELTDHYRNCSSKKIHAADLSESEDVSQLHQFYGNGLEICLPRLRSFRKQKNRFLCAKCKMSFDSLTQANEHYNQHEQDDEESEDVDQLWVENEMDKVHVCGICLAQFADGTYIRQHVYQHLNYYACPYECNSRFKNVYRLTNHIDDTHLKAVDSAAVAKERLSCAECSKSFKNKNSLKAHMKNHTRAKKYICSSCPKAFMQKSDLTTHIRSHTDERPYACRMCDKCFRTSSHLRDHMSTHESLNRYECDVCGKLFKALRILNSHKMLHTGVKPFGCDVCGKAFVRRQHLKLHLNVHEGVEIV